MNQYPKTQETVSRISFVANAVSYRIPLPVTKVIRLGSRRACFPVCPRCSSSMDREYTAFCDRCGQKLNWDVLCWADV